MKNLIKTIKGILSNKLIQLGLFSLLIASGVYSIIRFLWFPTFIASCEDQFYCGFEFLEGFTGLIMLSLIIGGSVFAWWEYSRQENQMSFQIYEAIHGLLTDPSQEAARRWIYQEIQPLKEGQDQEAWIKEVTQKLHDPSTLDERGIPIGQSNLKRVLNSFDYFGFITENYMNVEGPFLEWMSAPIAKTWTCIEPFMEYERKQRDEDDYYKSAFFIGKLCVEHRSKQGLGSRYFDGAT
jgi:hypothetical protein